MATEIFRSMVQNGAGQSARKSLIKGASMGKHSPAAAAMSASPELDSDSDEGESSKFVRTACSFSTLVPILLRKRTVPCVLVGQRSFRFMYAMHCTVSGRVDTVCQSLM
jgi:hypothetical protein